MLKEYILGIVENRYVLMSLIQRDLQMKYRRSKLGVAWSILMPLGLALIVGTVYGILFSANPIEFIPMLFSSINPWGFMSNTADSGTVAFIGSEGYIKQSPVNVQIFPLQIASVNLINLLYSILAFFAIYLFLQPQKFGPIMLMTIPGLIIMFIFALGLANISSIITLFLRDFQQLQGLVLQGLFYATPIIFSPKMLAERGWSIIYEVNPFYYMLEVVRVPMQGNGLPSLRVYCISIIIAVSVFSFSVYILMKHKVSVPYQL